MADNVNPHHGKEEVELKHLCKYCGKRFRSGRSLGGHLRSHMQLMRQPQADGKVLFVRKLPPLSYFTKFRLFYYSDSDSDVKVPKKMEVSKKEAVDFDNVEAFLASLDPNHETCPRETVIKLIRQRAIGCLTALLERKLPHNRLDMFAYPDSCRPLIFAAAERGFHGAVELFLRVPPSARVPTHCPQPDQLPIDAALYPSCLVQFHSAPKGKIYYDQRLCTLMHWLPQWISYRYHFDCWRTVKLLGRATEQGLLEMRILHYARYGQAHNLLWLLLAVPDRVLSPTFFRDTILQQRFGTAPLSLRDFLIAQLAFLTGISLAIEPNHSLPDKWSRHDLHCRITSITCSLRLLEVFRRAGPQLCHLMAMLEKEKEKKKSEREKERQMYPLLPDYPIAQHFKTVLKEAGFPMASLSCPVRSKHPNDNTRHGYHHWMNLRDDYPGLELLIRPPHVCRSKILDSDFNKAIENLCHHPCLKEWTSQMSIFKLLFIFCIPDVVENMQSVLPLEPKYVNPATVIQPAYLAELCFIYITEGRIVNFTAALMAAQVLLRLGYPLRPQTSRHSNNDVDHHHHKSVAPTVYEWLLHALMRVLDEEISLIGKPKDNDSVQICKEKRLMISSAFQLTKIFDTSAQDIHWYLHSPRYKEVADLKLIVNDVASLLKGTGFALRPQDICVNDLNCFSSKSGSSKTKLRGNSSSFGPLPHTGKSLTISTRTIKSSFSAPCISELSAPSISELSARSYHSFPTSRYQGNKSLSLPPGNGVSSVEKKVEATRRLDAMSRKNWRFLAVIKRAMMRF